MFGNTFRIRTQNRANRVFHFVINHRISTCKSALFCLSGITNQVILKGRKRANSHNFKREACPTFRSSTKRDIRFSIYFLSKASINHLNLLMINRGPMITTICRIRRNLSQLSRLSFLSILTSNRAITKNGGRHMKRIRTYRFRNHFNRSSSNFILIRAVALFNFSWDNELFTTCRGFMAYANYVMRHLRIVMLLTNSDILDRRVLRTGVITPNVFLISTNFFSTNFQCKSIILNNFSTQANRHLTNLNIPRVNFNLYRARTRLHIFSSSGHITLTRQDVFIRASFLSRSLGTQVSQCSVLFRLNIINMFRFSRISRANHGPGSSNGRRRASRSIMNSFFDSIFRGILCFCPTK